MSDSMVTMLLEHAREPEPMDNGFTERVMTTVRVQRPRRSRVIALRRPVVGAIVAAVVVTGGTVAALVGTRPDRPQAPDAGRSEATVAVQATPDAPETTRTATKTTTSSAPAAPAAATTPSAHTASVTDRASGLRLAIDTHSTTFAAGKAMPITVTLSNTGKDSMAVSPQGDCLLALWAYPMGGYRPNPRTDFKEPSESNDMAERHHFTRNCASGDSNHDAQPLVLDPGQSHTVVSKLTLAAGRWGVMGLCGCSWVQAGASPKPPSILEQLERAVPAPLDLEISVGDGGLATPGVRIQAVKPE